MSSSTLILVNTVLNTSGDYQDLTVVTGAPGDIGDRIKNFLNSTIAEMELLVNWPRLRQDMTATTDGNSIYTYSGTSDARVDGPVSVWITDKWALDELTPNQFDDLKAREGTGGSPLYYQRRVGTNNQLAVEIIGTPVIGEILNVSSYVKASKLSLDADTTEFDDEVLVMGALMRLDAYDGLERGYASLYKKMRDDIVNAKFRNTTYRIDVESYA